MKRTYKIQPRLADLEGGWHLKLYEDNQEAGGGMYPLQKDNPHASIEWWNELPDTRRVHWLMMGASAMLSAARYAYLLTDAYNDAMGAGESWTA